MKPPPLTASPYLRPSGFFTRGWICIAPLLALVLSASLSAFAQEAPAFRRGDYAAFKIEADVLSPTDTVVRRAAVGEVVRLKIVKGEWAAIGTDAEGLDGGKVKLQDLRPATADEYGQWITGARERAEAEKAARIAAAMPLDPAPPAPEESAMEAREASLDATPIAPAPVVSRKQPSEPILGWFCPATDTRIQGITQLPDGSVVLAGSGHPPFHVPTARAWAGPLPGTAIPGSAPLPFLARITPEGTAFADFVVFAAGEVAAFGDPQAAPDGGVWVAATGASETLAGPDATKAASFLLRFDPDLRMVTRSMALLAGIKHFRIDAQGRPVVLTGSPGRSGGGFLTKYFSQGRYERSWPDAPDGATRRLKLDFSSPALAEGPFALWAKKSETYPDMPTPIASWGSPSNAGQPMVWTNVKAGKNPIRGANLKPEELALDKSGNVLVAGTIPFHMGNPDFDPFLMRFSPQGKLLWTNCFLDGLLSEPDQKTQAVAIDPTNGDILICDWQHGNNKQTMLLDPNGWLTKFTGTNGNIKITWIGRVDAGSGVLKNSTYIYSQMPESKNPRWPDLNSAGVDAMQVADNGRVYAAGGTTISFPTTSNALLPTVTEYGSHPMLTVLRPDLSAPHYSTYLSAGKGGVQHLAILPGGAALCIGTQETGGAGFPVSNTGDFAFLSDSEPADAKDAVFFAIIPIPADEAGWSFNN